MGRHCVEEGALPCGTGLSRDSRSSPRGCSNSIWRKGDGSKWSLEGQPTKEQSSFSPKLASFQNWRLVWRLAVKNGTPLQYSCLENPTAEEPGRLQSMGSLRVGHDWATSLSLFTFMYWRRKWQPTPVFLPGESQGQGSLVGSRLWGHTESDTTEAT